MKICNILYIALLLFGTLVYARDWQVIAQASTSDCAPVDNVTFTLINSGFHSSTCTPYISNVPFGDYANVVCRVANDGQITNRLELFSDPQCSHHTHSFSSPTGTCVSTSTNTSFLKYCTPDDLLDENYFTGMNGVRATVRYGSDSTCNPDNATQILLINDDTCDPDTTCASPDPTPCTLDGNHYVNTYCNDPIDIMFALGFSFNNGGLQPDSPITISAEFSDTRCRDLVSLEGQLPFQSATGDCYETSCGDYKQAFCGAMGYQIYGGITQSMNDTCADGDVISDSTVPVCLANDTSSSVFGCSSYTNPFVYNSMFRGAQFLAGYIAWDGRGCQGTPGSAVVSFSFAPINTCFNYTPPDHVGVFPVPGPNICFRVEPSYFMFRCDTPHNLFNYIDWTILNSRTVAPTPKPSRR